MCILTSEDLVTFKKWDRYTYNLVIVHQQSSLNTTHLITQWLFFIRLNSNLFLDHGVVCWLKRLKEETLEAANEMNPHEFGLVKSWENLTNQTTQAFDFCSSIPINMKCFRPSLLHLWLASAPGCHYNCLLHGSQVKVRVKQVGGYFSVGHQIRSPIRIKYDNNGCLIFNSVFNSALHSP